MNQRVLLCVIAAIAVFGAGCSVSVGSKNSSTTTTSTISTTTTEAPVQLPSGTWNFVGRFAATSCYLVDPATMNPPPVPSNGFCPDTPQKRAMPRSLSFNGDQVTIGYMAGDCTATVALDDSATPSELTFTDVVCFGSVPDVDFDAPIERSSRDELLVDGRHYQRQD